MNSLNSLLRNSTISILTIRAITIAFGFLLVPLTYNYLGNYGYGIWATIFSFANWINLMDVGISNGLRNDLTKAIGNNEELLSRRLISTGYIAMGFITALLILTMIIIHLVFNIGVVLDSESSLNLSSILTVSVILMISNLYVKLIHSVFYAIHKPVWIYIINLVSNVLIFLAILSYRPNQDVIGSLTLISLVYLGTPLIIYLVTSLFFLSKLNLLPKRKYYRHQHLKGLVSLSSKFFIIQMAVVIVNTSDTFIINTLFSPTATANFSILNKYSSIIIIGTTTFFTPLWALYTKAQEEKKYYWIRNIIKKQRLATLLIMVICVTLLLLSKYVFKYWIGESFEFAYTTLVIIFGIALIHYWCNIHAIYLNGIGDLKLQTKTAVISIILNVPLSIFLGKYYGVNGVLLATIISISVFGIFGTIEVNKRLNEFG